MKITDATKQFLTLTGTNDDFGVSYWDPNSDMVIEYDGSEVLCIEVNSETNEITFFHNTDVGPFPIEENGVLTIYKKVLVYELK